MNPSDYSAFFFAGAFFGATDFFSAVSATFASSEEAFFFEKEVTSESGLSDLRAVIVTRALVILFGAPCCFAMTSLIPDTANILRTDPHAMIPVPG